MEKIDKKNQEAEFIQQHTITPQEFNRMIAEKMERARAYTNALIKKQEILLEDH